MYLDKIDRNFPRTLTTIIYGNKLQTVSNCRHHYIMQDPLPVPHLDKFEHITYRNRQKQRLYPLKFLS